MRNTFIIGVCLAGCLALASSQAQNSSPAPAAPQTEIKDATQANEQFSPFAHLIGEWDVKATEDGPVAAIIRVRWGPNRSYL